MKRCHKRGPCQICVGKAGHISYYASMMAGLQRATGAARAFQGFRFCHRFGGFGYYFVVFIIFAMIRSILRQFRSFYTINSQTLVYFVIFEINI